MCGRLGGSELLCSEWRLPAVVGALIFMLALVSAAPAFAANGWTGPTPIDPSFSATALSCGSTSFCAALDSSGKAMQLKDGAWSLPASIDGPNRLTAVSCASASFCMAVDSSGNALTFDGGSWGPPATVGPALTSVSCVSASFCVATGDGVATNYNGATWSAPITIGSSASAWKVSCASTSLCVAVGGSDAAVFDGSSWGLATTVDSEGEFRDVSCPSASFCVAVDSAGAAWTFNGDSWSGPAFSPITALNSVSCVSTTFCVAIGLGQATVFDGQSWSAPERFPDWDSPSGVSCRSTSFCVAFGSAAESNVWTYTGTWGPAVGLGGQVRQVSCGSPSLCAVVDDNGRAVTFGGHAWSAPVRINNGTNELNGVSCASALFCAAVGSDGPHPRNGNRASDAILFDGTSWGEPTDTSAFAKFGVVTPLSVSCASSSLCVETKVDDEGGFGLLGFNGSGWGAMPGAPTEDNPSVSCPTDSFCMLVEGSPVRSFAHFATFNGTSWSAPVETSDLDGLVKVSCASATFCVALDTTGRALTYDGGSWSAPSSAIDPNGVSSLSCPSSSFCAAVDGAGDVVTYDGHAWSAPVNIDGTTNGGLVSVSCRSASFCVAIDAAGNALVHDTDSVEHALTVTLGGDGHGSASSDPIGIACPGSCANDYDAGTSVTLTATPASDGSTFTGWSGGGCTGTGTCTVAMNSDQAVTASFKRAPELTVTEPGNGFGSVTSDPSGISCPGTCSASYAAGTSVTLTALASAGSVFTGWSGGGCSGTGTCTVVLNSDQSVTATFTRDTLTVQLAGTGAGRVTSSPAGISCPGTCSASFDVGKSVNLRAVASAGSTFAGWSGAGCSGVGTCRVALNSDQSVTATFTLNPHTLTVEASGSGAGKVISSPAGIACPDTTCAASFAVGSSVTLTATASAGSTFAGWSGGGCSGGGTCTVVMSADQTVTATFAAVTPELDVSVTGDGAVTSTPSGISCTSFASLPPIGACSDSYGYGTKVMLTAAPASGWVFGGWSGGGCSGTAACTVTMTALRSVSAVFTLPKQLITPPAAPTCTLTPAGKKVLTRADKHHESMKPRTLQLTASCDQSVSVSLVGTLISTPKRSRGSGKKPKAKHFTVHGGGSAAAGQPLTLTVQLPKAALRSGAHDSISFTLTATDADGSATARAEISKLKLIS